ncbi:MAG: ferrochelatase [Alphaproteobacteria bacterium]|nr:ferrochelatase [Alphaproteobacteria bacterium]
MTKLAVVLFNLGGPDRLQSVQPFLFNLFNDPAIVRVPGPVRWLLAQFISRRRAPVAREIYARLGGGSPLRANTDAQARALSLALAHHGAVQVFVVMRYWHPMSPMVVEQVKAFAPDRIVLLPLYPQFSTTTTASSLRDWQRSAARAGLIAPTRVVGCYPTEPGLVEGLAAGIAPALTAAAKFGKPRLMFSAHGLPERIVAAGDPYQWQIELTARRVAAALQQPELDWLVCYQSRVGPLKWIGPSTEDELRRAGRDRVPVVVAPVSFVSDHAETLVEIEVEYRRLAEAAGVPCFVRVPALGTDDRFIRGLARQVDAALGQPGEARTGHGGHLTVRPGAGERVCPAELAGCGCR